MSYKHSFYHIIENFTTRHTSGTQDKLEVVFWFGMKYKAIFFDADGVLIKSKHQFSDRLEKEYGIKSEKLQPFFMGVFRQCSVGKADLKKELEKVVGNWG